MSVVCGAPPHTQFSFSWWWRFALQCIWLGFLDFCPLCLFWRVFKWSFQVSHKFTSVMSLVCGTPPHTLFCFWWWRFMLLTDWLSLPVGGNTSDNRCSKILYFPLAYTKISCFLPWIDSKIQMVMNNWTCVQGYYFVDTIFKRAKELGVYKPVNAKSNASNSTFFLLTKQNITR